MITLRKIENKDAALMLEWMHDEDIQKGFRKKMTQMSLDDVKRFINRQISMKDVRSGDSLHFAIASEEDEYLGTISLKEIDFVNGHAEYAITTRKKAHGKGIAKEASEKMLDIAFNELGLHRVYLEVLSDNIAAIKLYEKCGFVYEGRYKEHLKLNDKYVDLLLYAILNCKEN